MQQSQNKTNNKQNKKQSPPRTKQKYPPSKKHPKTQNNKNPNEYHPGTMGINWMLLGHLGCTVSWIQGWNPYQASQELRPYTVLAEEPGWARGSLGISVIQLKVKLLVSSTCLRDPLGVVYFCYGIATPDSSPWGGQELASHHNRCPSKAALSLSLFPVFLLFIEYSIHAFVYLIHFTIPQNRWDTISDIKDLVNKTDKFLGPVKLAFWCWGQYTHTYMSMYIHIYICTYTDKYLWWWQHTYYKENNREELEIRAWVSRLLETGQSGKTSFRDRLFVCLFFADAWK